MYRISELHQTNRRLFHTNDLATAWGIGNRQTLHVTVSRYIDRGVLHPVYKGLYATVPLSDLDPLELGPAIVHGFTYLTTETVLDRAGAISQPAQVYTYAAAVSKRITVGPWAFRFRQLKDEYLHHPAGIETDQGAFVASPERAAADMLYYNPKFHFDVPEAVDFDRVRQLQGEIGYPHAGFAA